MTFFYLFYRKMINHSSWLLFCITVPQSLIWQQNIFHSFIHVCMVTRLENVAKFCMSYGTFQYGIAHDERSFALGSRSVVNCITGLSLPSRFHICTCSMSCVCYFNFFSLFYLFACLFIFLQELTQLKAAQETAKVCSSFNDEAIFN